MKGVEDFEIEDPLAGGSQNGLKEGKRKKKKQHPCVKWMKAKVSYKTNEAILY